MRLIYVLLRTAWNAQVGAESRIGGSVIASVGATVADKIVAFDPRANW
jgi:hypothetical protein